MQSTRVLTVLLVVLVLVPTGILGWLGVRGTDRFEAEQRRRLAQELDGFRTVMMTEASLFGTYEEFQVNVRVAAAADLIGSRLPFEPAGRTLDRARHVLHTFRNDRMHEHEFERFDRLWDPSFVELRILDAQGRVVAPMSYEAEQVKLPEGDAERLFADLAREADAAAFGRDDLSGALEIWRSAAARFSEIVWKARAEVGASLLAASLSRPAPDAERVVSQLAARYDGATLLRVGRPWVLLLLRSAGESASARAALRALHDEGALVDVPLSDEERARVRSLLGVKPPDGDVAAGAGHEVHRAALPAGAVLEITRRWSRVEGGRAGVLFAHLRRALPPTADLTLSPVPLAPPWFVSEALVDAITVPNPGGTVAWITLEHRDERRLLAEVKISRQWTILGVLSLVGVIGVGAILGRSALAREREARRLKDDFLANVSHELRTPLTSVCLHADLLAESGLAEPQRRAHAEVVRAEGARLSALVDDLLDFAALERGSRRLEPEPVDLGAAADRAVAPFRVLADREGVTLTLELAPGETLALADPHALGRILSNLVGNAWKHGRPSRDGGPGRLVIRAGVADGRPTVDVVDDGPGIPPKERAHLFERFRRGAAAGKTRGVGLGLALSRDLARALGGDLSVVEDPARTVFRLTLPPVPPAPPESTPGIPA